MTDKSWDVSLRPSRFVFSTWLTRLRNLHISLRVAGLIGSLLLGIILYVIVSPVYLQNIAPSGADPGNWLSLAWAITGDGSRLANWAYPPLTFVILRLLLYLFPPLVALKILGFSTWLILGAAMWAVLLRFLKHLPMWFRFGLAVLFCLTGYTAEMFAWGGYPQILGLAFLILAMPWVELWLVHGQWKDGFLAVFLSVGVVYTHHLMTAMLPILWLLILGWLWFANRWQRKVLGKRFLQAVAFALFLSLPAVPIYWRYVHLLQGNPLDASGYSWNTFTQAIVFVFRGLVPFWLALLAAVSVAPWLAPRVRLSASSFAFTFGPLVLFFITWEVRLLQLLFVGIILGLGLLFDQAWVHPSSRRYTQVRQGLLVLSFTLALAAAIPQDVLRFHQASDYYQVVSNDVIPGLNWLQANSAKGERVAVSRTHPDMLGWWVEGLARRPALYATDLRWLSFKGERDFASVANQIFDPSTTEDQADRLIEANDIRWLFIDKKYDPKRLSGLVSQGLLQTAYEDQRILILKVVNHSVKQQAGLGPYFGSTWTNTQ